MLLGKCVGAGWDVLVRAKSDERLAQLDEVLWLRPEDGFLPHGVSSGGSEDAEHPILLTNNTECPARAALACVDGAPLDPSEVNEAERAMILFDGRDPEAVEHARTQWRALTGAGCSAQYWSEESGRWEMKAESGTK